MEELQKLYDAVSGNFDVGSFDEFSAKMGDTESRKSFYDTVATEGFDIGDYNEYETRLSGTAKEATAETNGDSVSDSASTESSSESKRTLVDKIDAGEIDTTYNPDPDGILEALPDRGLKAKEAAAKKLKQTYESIGIKDYEISDNNITEEALRMMDTDRLKGMATTIDKINSSSNPKEQRSYWSNLLDNIAAGSTELGTMISSIPETMYDLFALPQNAFSKLTGVDIETSSSKFKEDHDISNPILDYYLEENKEIHEKIDQFNTKYESTSIYENIKSGNYGDAFELLGSGLAQSAPISLGMMAGGAATTTGKLAGYGTVAFTGKNRLDIDENNPELAELDKTLKAIGLAGAETVFASISQGSMGKVYKDIILKEGVENGKVVFKQGLIKMYETALKKYGGAVGALGEGIEEVATTVTQNMIEGRDAFVGIEDSFIQGVAGGGLYGAPINIKNLATKIKKGYDVRQVNKIIEAETNDYVQLSDAFSPEGSITADKIELVGKPNTYEMLEKELDKSVKDGDIDEKTAEAHKKDFLDTSLTVSKTKGVNLSKEGQVKAVTLIKEKEQLKADIKILDDALAAPKKERVLAIDEQLMSLTTEDKAVQKAEVKAEEQKKNVEVDKEKTIGKDVDVNEYADEQEFFQKTSPHAWAVDKVEGKDLQDSQITEHEGTYGVVTPDGDIKGLFNPNVAKLRKGKKAAKGTLRGLLPKLIARGGKKLDNFDGRLTKMYEDNGFRVVSRTPFNEEYAPEGWDKKRDGTPDVVAMIYDPAGTADIKEKKFSDPSTGYDQMIEYRDKALTEAETNQLGSELDDFMGAADVNLQLDTNITPKQKKKQLEKEATQLMEEVEGEGFTEEVFTADKPAPTVKTHTLEIKENSDLAKKVRRMGLEELVGKKVNLVMADQLKVGEVKVGDKRLPRMGGHMFPLMDKLFGKVAWASINKGAANSIINGAIGSDYTIVYNMSPSAVDSNIAIFETVVESIKALPKSTRTEVFTALTEYLQSIKHDAKTEIVHEMASTSKNIEELMDNISTLDVDTKSRMIKKILPSKDKTSTTDIGKLLQDNKIDIEGTRDLNVEQFVSDLPAGAMTMVLEVQDKSGKKVTKETKDEALMTPDQQKAEGLPQHQNYPMYVRGKAVAILEETVPFWNMFKTAMGSINAKVAGIVKTGKGDKKRNITSKEARSNEMRRASMTANQVKKLSEAVSSGYENFIGLLQRSFPTIETVTSEQAFNELTDKLGAKKLATKNQKVYGAVYEGKLYLNPALENFNTPIHEFGHVWLNTAKGARPELYNKGIQLISGSEYENNVRDSKEYQKVIKQMKAEGATDADIDNYIAEEALATAIGDKGESFVTAAQKKGFKNWLNNLYSFVRKLTGLSKMTPEQVQNMTLEDFVQGVSVDILSGNEVFDKAQVSALSDALQLHTVGKTDAELLVEYSRGKGYSDEVIKKALAKRGFSAAEINAATAPNPLITKLPTSKQVTKLNASLAGKIKTLKKKGTAKKRAAKMPNTKLFTEAWDTALDLVADTVSNTGNFAQGMYDGIESLRNSDWYRKLSDAGRAKAERMFREDINRQYDGDKVQQSWSDSMKASLGKMKTAAIQKLIDKYHIVRKTMNENFDISDDSVNFSQAEINMHGKAANDIDKFDKQMEGLMKEISDKGLEVQNVSDYMYAKHAEERNKYIKEHVDGENEFGSGMTPQEIDKILNGTFTEDQIKDLETLSEQFYGIIQGTRDIMLDSGLITEEQHMALSEFYENYVPLQGYENTDIVGSNQIQGKKLDVAGHLLERSAGRSTRADNVIANIVASRVSAVVKARKNEVLQTLHKLGTENPNNGVFAVYTQETLPSTIDVDKTGKKVDQKEDARGRMDYVGVKVDGEQYYLKFANEELGRVLNASNVEKASIVGKVLRSMNRYLSQTLTTLNPEFVISNFSRDIQTAILNVMAEADTNAAFKGQNIAKDVVKDTGKAIKAIYSNERLGKTDTEYQKYYEEFKDDGAKTGWANQADITTVKKRMEAMVRHNNAKGLTRHNAAAKGKAILNFVNDINTAVENGVRLSAYANARKAGLTRDQAARMAKELTVNFNKSGEYGTVLNSMYLFFNAAIQGNVRFIKAMTTLKSTINEDGSVKKSLNRGQKLALSLTAFSAVMTLVNQGISDDDDDGESFYNKIPDFEKERNLIMMNPLNGKDYFKIPLPYGYNIFHNFGTVAAEVASGDREVGDGIGFLTSAAVGAFSPVSFGGGDSDVQNSIVNAFTPTIAKPIVDLARNEDYFGSQIYNENFPMGTPKPDSSMGRTTTPEAFKAVTTFLNEVSGGNEHESGAIDIAPESMYYIYKFAIGGTGKFLQNTAESIGTGIDIASGQEKRLEPRKIPFVRKVYGEPNKYADQTDFFNNYDEVRQKLEAVKAKVASEKDMDNRSGIGATEKAYKEASKLMKDLRKKKKHAETIEDPIKRTETLNKLDKKYYDIIRKANGTYNKRMKNKD